MLKKTEFVYEPPRNEYFCDWLYIGKAFSKKCWKNIFLKISNS